LCHLSLLSCFEFVCFFSFYVFPTSVRFFGHLDWAQTTLCLGFCGIVCYCVDYVTLFLRESTYTIVLHAFKTNFSLIS
jgi:hypothetical protein